MKKSLHLNLAFIFIFTLFGNLLAAPFDTGLTTLKQPDGKEFTGRIWGDEFIWWAETEDGYRFIETGDGWYYYAALDQNGEYTPTNYKVSIDEPPTSSYQLERSQARLDEIKEQIEQFNEQIDLNRQWFAQKQAEAQSQPVTIRIGIILIEFTDTTHYKTDSQGNRPNGYYITDFDSMMFSYNYWNNAQRHPEEEEIFGSFRDYWHQMSKGNLRIIGKVVNPDTTGDGVPEWIMADTTRSYYADPNVFSWGHDTLANEAINKAKQYGYITDTPGPNYYDKLVVVYAQFARTAAALMVHAEGIGGKFIILGERSGPNLFGGLSDEKSFTHIGIYAHELAHTFGLYDEYPLTSNDTEILNFCLMAYGLRNGPDRKAACPATLSPYYRINYEWLPQPKIIENDTVNFVVEYDYDSPKIYRINPVDAPGNMHYLFEVRHREGFDSYIPAPPQTFPNNQPGTLIIWQDSIESKYYGTNSNYYDRIRIKVADYDLDTSYQSQLNDFFPSAEYQNYQCFNDTTLPAASMGNNYDEIIPFTIVPAHFALNGIKKQLDNTILIDEIKLNHPLRIVNLNSGGWQVASVPYGLNDYYFKMIFPTCTTAYKFDGTYFQVDTLENGPGYWVNFPSQFQRLVFTGLLIEYLEIPVDSGWNLTGSIPYVIQRLKVDSDPPGIVDLIYRYDNPGGYILLNSNHHLSGGLGYWTKTKGSGKIILDRYAESEPLPKIDSFSEINLDEMDKFIITDADGYSQTLYVTNIDIDSTLTDLNIDLPPVLPEIDFDSRFEYNEFVKRVSADSGTIDLNILVHTNSYPVNLSWDLNPENGINYSFINDSSTGKISNILNTVGNATFGRLNKNRIRLSATINKSNSNLLIPKDYVLEQNYPNPFNPMTKIRFAVPKESLVNLTVFNILGEKIKELKNEIMKPGYYEVNFEAYQFASGIYIYRIQANDFVNSKKMLLLK
jgi:M6 family metalloprotease-like protein